MTAGTSGTPLPRRVSSACLSGLPGIIGPLVRGRQADLVVIHGDPSSKITDIENVEIVFKDGVGYDSAKLIESVRGQVGLR